MKKYIISIDMGGTKILASVINSSQGVIARVKKSTKIKKEGADFAKILYGCVSEVLAETGLDESNIAAICVGVPGAVDPYTGIISMAPNLNLKNYHIKTHLQKYTKIPVLIENDVNLAALGILNYGVAKGKSNGLVVFIGTGIGGGLFFNGQIYRGAGNIAGEIGHINVSAAGPHCGCGKIGCFEALASRTAVVRDITADIKRGKRSVLAPLVKSKTQIKSRALADAVAKGDKVAVRHLSASARLVGKVLADLNNLLNLDIIVIGGGVTQASGKFIMPIIKEAFKQNSLKDMLRSVKIVPSKLADDAALYGGLALAKEFLDVKV